MNGLAETTSQFTNNKSTKPYREALRRESQERKTTILHLIFKYLIEHNLFAVAELLQSETQTGLHYQVCDNIDLEIMLREYQSYYYTKFQRNPKILRRLNDNEQVMTLKREKKFTPKEKVVVVTKKNDPEFQFNVVPLTKTSVTSTETKCFGDFETPSPEWKEMADQVMKQIVPKNLGITFKDCLCLNTTVETLKEAIIYPLLYPQLFETASSWKGVLLYGPPGTGKTLLAKALACETPSTFINVTSSAFTSKWRGESEKLVKVLFDVAKYNAPTTIFIDEIDALASTSQESNHEASRRFKSEILTQIDGIVKSEEVFVLASTNNPWAIDQALLRRFEKRILVPLPNKDSRGEILKYYFKIHGRCFSNEEMAKFVEMTEYFSASDLKCVTKEVEMMIVREKLQQLKENGRSHGSRQPRYGDVINALKKIKPSVAPSSYRKYIEWGSKFGAI